MKIILSSKALISAAVMASAFHVLAAPVTVPNFSFETPNLALNVADNAISNYNWTGVLGNNGQTFIENVSTVTAANTPGEGNNRQYLGMNLMYDVWQDLPTTFAAGNTYTLTVAIGNRSTWTNANNLSVYGLADATTGDYLDSAGVNASTITVNTFADGPAVVVHVPTGSALVGKNIRVLLKARGQIGATLLANARSHFDNIRLDASPMNANLPGVISTGPTLETASTATLNGTVTQVGSNAPTVTIYYGLQDGNTDTTKWLSNVVVAGTPTGAFSANVTGLTAASFYYYRIRATNTTGTTWSNTTGKFSTGGNLEIQNFSFEDPAMGTTGTSWSNNLGGSWLESGGYGNGNGACEYSAATLFATTPGVGNNRQYLMTQVPPYDVWQNTPHTFQAGKGYRLRVALGNRTGQTNAANSSQYAIQDTLGNIYDVKSQNVTVAPVVTAGTFADAVNPAIVYIPPGSPAVGKNIRVMLQCRGTGRSHFDNVRLETLAMDPNLPGVITPAATNLASTTATINGQVTQVGSAAPTVTFFWGPTDGGSDTTKWTGTGSGNFTVAGTQTGTFSNNITGLVANTPYFYRVRAVNATGTTWSAPAQTFTTLVLPPTMANLTPTQIGASSAKLGGNVVSTGGVTPVTKIYYGVTDGGTTVANWANSIDFGQQTAAFSRVVTGLLANQLYFFRASGTGVGGTGWAPASGTFTTAAASLPAITTAAATNVDLTSVTLNGNVTATGNDAPTVKFYYGTTDGLGVPANWTSNVSVGLQAGKTSVDLTGLTAGTVYYFRAAATNGAGTGWGATLTFTTDVITKPKVATRDATNVTSTIADLRGEVTSTGDEAPTVRFYWGTTDGGTVAASWTNVTTVGIDSGNFERVLTGLTPNTTYYFRAFAQNSAGSDWAGSTLSFTTPATDVASNLIINEIFFDPINATYWTEYVEIYNPTASPINLSGWRIGGTLIYNFGSVSIGAGDYLVVVLSPAAFDAAYGTICPVGKRVGPWARNGVVSTSPPDHSLSNGSGTITLYNPGGLLVDSVDYKAGFPWPTGSKGQTFPTTAQTHLTSLSTSLQHPNLDNTLGASWRAAIVTPGAVNFGYPISTPSINATPPALTTASAAPPAIRDVQHLPNAPKANDAVVITARVTDPDGVGSVTLQYQTVDPGNFIRKTDAAYTTSWTNLIMNDTGINGDAVAGDSLFTCTVPPAVQTHRRLVRYRIVVTDGLNNSITVPYADDEQLNFAYFVYNGIPAWQGALRPTAFALSGSTAFTPPITPLQTYSSQLLSTLPPWHLLAVATDVNSCQYVAGSNGVRFNGCLVYDGVVYDHILFTNRGIGSTYNTGKNKWNIFFNRARNLEMRDNWGKKFDQTWNNMSLDANASPWATVHRGAAGVEEAASYRAFDLAGNPALRTTYVHWRVIDGATEVGAPGTSVTDASFAAAGDGQYAGDFWGLYLSLEPMENNFIKERNLPSGNVYSIEGSAGDKKNQGPTQPVDASDWNTFRDGAQLGTSAVTGNPEQWYRDNLDLNSLYTLMAVGRLIGNIDVRPGDNFRYYHRSSDNRWVAMPYDLDMMFIPAHHWGGAMDGITVAGAPLTVRAMMRYPAIALEYRNRCREVLSLLGSDADSNGGQIGQLLDEYSQMVNPAGQPLTWADADAAMWNLHPKTTGSGANTGQNNPKGLFYRSLFLDGTRGGLGGTTQTGTWVRNLNDPDGDGFSDHEGIVEYLTNYATSTYPTAAPAWLRKATTGSGTGADPDIYRQKGYGYKYLEWEGIYGGYFNAVTNPTAVNADLLFPNKPTLTYTGSPGAPANNLTFTSGDFSTPSGGAAIAAVQFRLAEISAPGIPGYDATQPRVYEIEQVWNSGDIATSSPTSIASVRVPATYARVGSTYRVRVRHKDTTGRYSYWSEPAQFIVAPADISVLTNSLVISEYNYKPSPATLAETTAGYTTDDFEFIEVKNITNLTVDLTDARFTKGVDFNFPASMTIPANGFKLVVRNQAAFLSRYPTVSTSIIAGVYTPDKLSDSGEQIKLSYGAGAAVKDWTYATSDPGPAGANGNGRTVVLVSPATNPDHAIPTNWRPSYTIGGTPGADDPYTYAIWAAATGATTNADADDDNDGIINRLEYAFGGNASTPNDSGTQLPIGSFTTLTTPVVPTAGTYLTATFTRPIVRDDLTYTPEFSTDLSAWTGGAVLVSSTNNNDGTTTEIWRSATTVDTMQRWFIHVKVTQMQ